MMGEVIIKWFYFYYFINPTLQRCQKTKKYVVRTQRFFFYGAQSIRNAAETYNVFFSRIFLWVQNMEKWCKFIKKCCLIKFQKIRARVFTIAGLGDEQNQKTNMFSNSSLMLSFALCHGILLTRSGDVFWATLLYVSLIDRSPEKGLDSFPSVWSVV